MKIIIGSDVVPTKINYDLFIKGAVHSLLGESLLEIWENADYRIFNLEVPFTDKETPIEKNGPNLVAPESTFNGIKALNPSLVTIANNHILDQGIQGLKCTIDLLNEMGIRYIGAGYRLKEAMQPYVLDKKGLKIGFYACTESEFSIATVNSPGANPFDPLESFDHIKCLKKQCNYVIVLYHGGKEYYRYPSPYLQKISRKMVDKGADLVICQHSHCIGTFEKYQNSTIIYGQGNFIFNKYNNEYWNNSLLLNLTFNNNEMNIDYIPIVTVNKGVRLAESEIKNNILKEFYKRSENILEHGFVDREYERFAETKIDYYLRSLSASSKILTYIDRRMLNGYLLKKKFNKQKLLAMLNYIECESHRDLILAGLKGRVKK